MTTNKNTNKRLESAIEYVDALQEQYSKLNVIRVDLAYKKPYSDDVTLDEATKDLDRMFNNMRSKPLIFDGKVGYICKKEYTEDRGVHLHTTLFFDGQKVQKDSFKADQIGKYWQDVITQGKGSYHNCNRGKYEQSGIGMLDHRDSEKRKVLDEKVIAYLCKDEQHIGAVSSNPKDRAFTRGIIPKKSKGNVGRPRKEEM